MLIGGAGNDTGALPYFDAYIGAVDLAPDEPLLIQVFDVGMGGAFDSTTGANGARTCVELYSSPEPGVQNETDALPPLDEGTMAEAATEFAWYTVFDSDRDGHKAAALAASGSYWYHVRLKLSEGCQAAPSSQNEAFNAFKLRTNGQLRVVSGLTLYGADFVGDFASFVPGPNTNYDGKFDIPFHVGGVERADVEETLLPGEEELGISLEQADADDADLGAFLDWLASFFASNADGQRSDIFFQLFRGAPSANQPLKIKRVAGTVTTDIGEPTPPSGKVENPSGNASGEHIEYEKHTTHGVSQVQPGVHTWHWENVGAENSIMLQPVSGSPVNHEFIALAGRWASASGATPASRWQELGDEELRQLLPVYLGVGEFGYWRAISSPADARAALGNTVSEPDVDLTRELLALKLNVSDAHRSGESLGAGYVLSTRRSVDELVKQGDACVLGLLEGTCSTLEAAELIELMRTANSGQVTSLAPRRLVASRADVDADGLEDRYDNCPVVSNVGQTDWDNDGVGDACQPHPRVWCVSRRDAGDAVAVFGYESPLLDFRIPVGDDNHLEGEEGGVTPPVLFRVGGNKQAFTVPFVGSSVSWRLLGQQATATLQSPDCSLVGPGSASCEASSSEFHCCSTIEDCAAAEDFTLYAGSQLRLGERVRVVKSDGTPGKVLSLGSLIMQPEAEGGELLSGGDLLVGERATVLDFAAVNGAAVGAVDHVRTVRRVPMDAPDLAGLLRAFAGEGGTPLAVGSDAELELAPGSYGTAVLDGAVTLHSGTYHFSQLTVGQSARVTLDSSSGPVIVRVASTARFAGDVQATTGQLLVELDGSGTVTIEEPLTATIVAPEGEVWVAAGATFRGAIYADVISVAEDATIVQEPPVMPR